MRFESRDLKRVDAVVSRARRSGPASLLTLAACPAAASLGCDPKASRGGAAPAAEAEKRGGQPATKSDDQSWAPKEVVYERSAASEVSTEEVVQAGAEKKPNILVIWGDDIGQSNISAYTRGLVGYRTPNIDRIAREGMLFTDYYGEQSCTAGRSAFITGQSVFRTGLSKVGLPGAEAGLSDQDPTMAEVLKAKGYATGQFGKNHLGDRDEPLTKKRMETIDDETTEAALGFIEQQHEADRPFFVWWNGTRMHFRTHVREEYRGRSGQNEYADGMLEHDGHVGQLLDKLDELGIADDTLVFYSTDNGPHYNSWPDAAATPFRGEKNTNWEGGWRVPAMVRWPGRVPAGTVTNGIMSDLDWMPTIAAAAGDTALEGGVRVARGEDQLDIGMRRAKFRQVGQHQVGDDPPLQVGHLLFGALGGGQHLPPRVGQHVAVPGAIEEPRREPPFEGFHPPRHRGVAHPEGRTRPPHRPQPGQRQEVPHVVPVHRSWVPRPAEPAR